jgi:Pvc16 N-terminal domain
MIDSALILLRGEMEAYIRNIKNDTSADVRLDNIALLDTANGTMLRDTIIITMVNVEEESTLKNERNYRRQANGSIEYINTPVNLNLYLLITANHTGHEEILNDTSYIRSLRRIANVVEFFQSKNVFTPQNSPTFQALSSIDLNDPDIANLKIYIDLYTLTFEQINHLWGSLGGKQLPFVMYKLRLVQIQNRDIRRDAPLIEEIQTNIHNIQDC